MYMLHFVSHFYNLHPSISSIWCSAGKWPVMIRVMVSSLNCCVALLDDHLSFYCTALRYQCSLGAPAAYSTE